MTKQKLEERVQQMLKQKDNPLTSVVTLSFNRKDDLENNINSLYEHTNLPFEVVIWDNASDPETIEYLKRIEGTTKEDGNGLIRVLYSDHNLGCSGGRREAVKQTKGNWIYTSDNDMTYTPNWLESIIDRVEQDPNIGAANSKIVYPNGKIQVNGGILILEDNYFGSFVSVDEGKDQSDPNLMGEMDCDWLCGGATLVKRKVADQVEHESEYLNGYEDYDYSFQIANLGYKIVNCPESTLVHNHIIFDEAKQEKEQSYLKSRWSSKRIWTSMVYFLERTGINMVETSHYYNWIERDGTKPFLKWGHVRDVKFEYEDLFPGRALSELTSEELRTQFDSMTEKNKEIRSQIANNGMHYSTKDIIKPLAEEIDGAFSRYNLDNLARHLDGVLKERVNGKGRLSNDDVSYLIGEFSVNVVKADQKKANIVYDKLRERFSKLMA